VKEKRKITTAIIAPIKKKYAPAFIMSYLLYLFAKNAKITVITEPPINITARLLLISPDSD